MSYTTKNNKPTKTKKAFQITNTCGLNASASLPNWLSHCMWLYICCFCYECVFFSTQQYIIIVSWKFCVHVYSFIVLLWHLRRTRGEKEGWQILLMLICSNLVLILSNDQRELVFQKERERETKKSSVHFYAQIWCDAFLSNSVDEFICSLRLCFWALY